MVLEYSDDRDMKIVQPFSPKKNQIKDTEKIEEELLSAKASGKLETAKLLGNRLAVTLHEQKGLHQFGADDCESSNIGMQRKFLLAFCIDSTVEQSDLSSVLKSVVINSFYDSLKCLDSTLYNHIRQSGAWSFYFLALRRGGDIERNISKTFAMLCGYDGNHIFQEYGEALYSKFTNVIAQKIKNAGL